MGIEKEIIKILTHRYGTNLLPHKNATNELLLLFNDSSTLYCDDAMEFLKTLHNLDEIWKEHEDSEYNERQLTQFAERYHEHKLK